jgi:hypothetical protein
MFLAALSILPLLLLKVYIQVKGNFDARWYVIRYAWPQIGIWAVFGACLVYGMIRCLGGSRKNGRW